jgi:hypothetical protein
MVHSVLFLILVLTCASCIGGCSGGNRTAFLLTQHRFAKAMCTSCDSSEVGADSAIIVRGTCLDTQDSTSRLLVGLQIVNVGKVTPTRFAWELSSRGGCRVFANDGTELVPVTSAPAKQSLGHGLLYYRNTSEMHYASYPCGIGSAILVIQFECPPRYAQNASFRIVLANGSGYLEVGTSRFACQHDFVLSHPCCGPEPSISDRSSVVSPDN